VVKSTKWRRVLVVFDHFAPSWKSFGRDHCAVHALLVRPAVVAEISDQAPAAAELATTLLLIYEIEKGDALLEHRGADAE
jgi:hypothetical protein